MRNFLYIAATFFLCELCFGQDYYAVAIAEVQSSSFHSQVESAPGKIFLGTNINLKIKNIHKIGGGRIPKVFSGITTAADVSLRKGDLIVVRYRFYQGKLQYQSWDLPSEFFCFDTKLLSNIDSRFEVAFETKMAAFNISCLFKSELIRDK